MVIGDLDRKHSCGITRQALAHNAGIHVETISQETNLMEDSVRCFLEESDSLQVCYTSFAVTLNYSREVTSCQGVQVMHETNTFGAFINSLLTSFRDEFSKHPLLTFPLLSNAEPGHIDIDDVGVYLSLPLYRRS